MIEPIPSSTVMLLRPSEGGFELFMVRRHSKSRFMPDRYVFPGGRLEETDSSPQALALLHGYQAAKPVFRDLPSKGAFEQAVTLSSAQEVGLYFAAFRELFEEAGVLLAIDENGQPTRWQNHEMALADARKANFIELLEREMLKLDFGSLVYFSHWITPLVEPYRFDARFFLACVEAGQQAQSDYFETTDGLWIRPDQALARHTAGTFEIGFPTIMHLEWLAKYATLEAAYEAAQHKPVITLMPDPHDADFRIPLELVDQW